MKRALTAAQLEAVEAAEFDNLLTIGQAADVLDVHPRTVRGWVDRGEIGSGWLDGVLVVVRSEVSDREHATRKWRTTREQRRTALAMAGSRGQ